ncbi:MAG TPA: hypothetical protein VLE93_03695 [Candidatus Saccharimonadales bacterium]|nr:hypothetical protein [Candidatus Saccharimonadales bacterium]
MRTFFFDLLKNLGVLLLSIIMLVVVVFGWNAYVDDNHARSIKETLNLQTNVRSFWQEMQKNRSLDDMPSQARNLADFALAIKKAQKAHETAKNLAAQNPGLLSVNNIVLTPSEFPGTPKVIRAYVLIGDGEEVNPKGLEWHFDEDQKIVNSAGVDVLLKGGRFVPNPVFQQLVFPGWPFLVFLWVGLGLLVCIATENQSEDRASLISKALAQPVAVAGLSALNPLYGLYFGARVWTYSQKQPKNAHAKEIRKTRKLLQILSELEPTEAIRHRIGQLQSTLIWLESNPNSTSAEVAKLRQKLARETAADNQLSKLIPQIEEVTGIPDQEKVRAEEHHLNM